jgi:predicted dienelactone hydrolase
MSALRPRVARTILLGLAWALWACSQAMASTLGLMRLPALPDGEPLTVMYPSTGVEQAQTHGGATRLVALSGPLAAHNGHLIVISHGSGGSAWPYVDLARELTQRGFVVALPQHRADHWQDDSDAGPVSWERRPREVSQAIDRMATLPAFAGQLDLEHVGMYGMSAGGHTALTLAGGRWSARTLHEHCQAHLEDDYTACAGPFHRLSGSITDGVRKTITRTVLGWRLRDTRWHSYSDARIRAIVAGVPFAADFDPASFASVQIPLALVTAQSDVWLRPTFHSSAVLTACPRCELLLDLPTGGHGALLSPLPDPLPSHLQDLLSDPPGFDRAADVPRLQRRIADYFVQHLLTLE